MKRVAFLAMALAINCGAPASDGSFDLGVLFLRGRLVEGSGVLRIGGAVAIDGENNYYVSGTFQKLARFGTNLLTASHLSDAYLAKYDQQTNLVWVRQIPNAAATCVAVWEEKGIFIAGRLHGDTQLGGTLLRCQGEADFFLAKYDNAGGLRWLKHAGVKKFAADAFGVAVDAAGNIYMAGESAGPVMFEGVELPIVVDARFLLAKFDPNGKLLWAEREAGDSTNVRDIALDAEGNAYVTGTFYRAAQFGPQGLTTSGGPDLFLAKYDTKGRFLWARTPGGPPERFGHNVAVDSQGNPHVVGTIQGTMAFGSTNLVIVEPDGQTNRFLAKYSAAGDFQWVRQFRNGDFDFSNVVNVEASGVKLSPRLAVGATSKPFSTLPAENKVEAVQTALNLGNGVPPGTAQVQAPVLRLQKSGAFIVLFWSKDLTNVMLEASETLAPFPVWKGVDTKAEAVGGQMAVSIPVSSAMKFYRLHRP